MANLRTWFVDRRLFSAETLSIVQHNTTGGSHVLPNHVTCCSTRPSITFSLNYVHEIISTKTNDDILIESPELLL